MKAVSQLAQHIRDEMGKVVVGQDELRDQCVIALLCRGHVLLEGVPGIAKTLTVKTLARLVRLDFQRVQCTSDLMPADIVGTNILNMATSSFLLHQGPVFTDLLLVDEVNRMPPRTQAALLECMEEHQVTIDGKGYPLSAFFTVFATQNPVEFEGTYPLPEAQIDRFLLKVQVPYPGLQDEVRLLANVQNGFESRELDKMNLQPIDAGWLEQAQQELKAVTVEEALFSYIVQIARRTREWPSLSLGASPRAAVSLMAVAKAVAAMDGRDYVIPDDVKASARPVLRHRIILKPEADLEGITPDQVLADVLRAVEVPK
jgi:MoxR-like ATPase